MESAKVPMVFYGKTLLIKSAPATSIKKEKNMFGLVLGALYYMLLIALGIFAIWGFSKWLWEMLTYFDS